MSANAQGIPFPLDTVQNHPYATHWLTGATHEFKTPTTQTQVVLSSMGAHFVFTCTSLKVVTSFVQDSSFYIITANALSAFVS